MILDNLSLSVKQGDCIGLVGKNGCGKSTLLSLITGCLIPQSGSIFIDGKDALQKAGILVKHIGYVPQNNPFIPELTVLDNLIFWYKGNTKQLMKELNHNFDDYLGIQELLPLKTSHLSGGQLKRVNIVSALLNHPSLLVLDEPSSSLDLVCKKEIKEFLLSYINHHGTVIIATHDESELDLCNRIYSLRNGCLHAIPPSLRGEELINTL